MASFDLTGETEPKTEEREIVSDDASLSHLLGAVRGVRGYTLDWKEDLNKTGVRLDEDCEALLDEHLARCDELENTIEKAGADEIIELRDDLRELIKNWEELERKIANGGPQNTDVEEQSTNSRQKRTDPSKSLKPPEELLKSVEKLSQFSRGGNLNRTSGGIAKKLSDKESLHHLLKNCR